MQKSIFLIPGLGTDARIFDHLTLPHARVKIIEWIEPLKEESLADYCRRLSAQIDSPSPVIIGVSFGGMVAVELSRIVACEKVILISSAKYPQELPGILKPLVRSGMLALLPASLIRHPPLFLLNYLFGISSDADKKLLKEIIRDTDPDFVKWAVQAMATWEYKEVPERIVTIHGRMDKVIPFQGADYPVDTGGHFMIVNRSREIAEILSEII